MAGLLYYVPKLRGADKGQLKKVGIDTQIEAGITFVAIIGTGPDGGTGGVVVPKTPREGGKVPDVGYYPDKQRWEKAPGKEYWIGHETENPPTPADLAREDIISGHQVKLVDGNEWTIPVARVFSGGTLLPSALRLGEDGEIEKTILHKFEGFSKRSEALWEQLVNIVFVSDEDPDREEGEDYDITVKDGWEIACEALCLNYAMTQREISFLSLISTDNVKQVLISIVDIPSLDKFFEPVDEAGHKKKDDGAT